MICIWSASNQKQYLSEEASCFKSKIEEVVNEEEELDWFLCVLFLFILFLLFLLIAETLLYDKGDVNRCFLDDWFSPNVSSGWRRDSISQLSLFTSYYLVSKLFSLDNITSLLPSRIESLVLSCSSISHCRKPLTYRTLLNPLNRKFPSYWYHILNRQLENRLGRKVFTGINMMRTLKAQVDVPPIGKPFDAFFFWNPQKMLWSDPNHLHI